MNVKRLSLRELDVANAQITDELVSECSKVHKQRERMGHLSDLLFIIQLERQSRLDDPWADEDTAILLTDADLAIAYAQADGH